MKKMMLFVLAAAMLILACGCSGDVVVLNQCDDCTVSAQPTEPVPTETQSVYAGSLKTGLAVFTNIADSASTVDDEAGAAAFDVTIAAVTVDENGVIQSAVIDSVPATVGFLNDGSLNIDTAEAILTKNELGENYGMVAWGGAIAEWDAQVAALCDFAVGKTVEELKNGAVDETGKAPQGSDLASSATIYLGGFVSALEAAANNAQSLGAQGGDRLKLAINASVASSAPATEEQAGYGQLDVSIAALTEKDGVITSCIIDELQAKVDFDVTGQIVTDLAAPVQTKNELGEAYGMVAWGNAIAEWNAQAASFAKYVTGKTLDEVMGISVTETTKPADGTDLASSVTIAIGGFQALIRKALG